MIRCMDAWEFLCFVLVLFIFSWLVAGAVAVAVAVAVVVVFGCGCSYSCGLLNCSCWALATVYLLPAFGCWLLVTGYRWRSDYILVVYIV